MPTALAFVLDGRDVPSAPTRRGKHTVASPSKVTACTGNGKAHDTLLRKDKKLRRSVTRQNCSSVVNSPASPSVAPRAAAAGRSRRPTGVVLSLGTCESSAARPARPQATTAGGGAQPCHAPRLGFAPPPAYESRTSSSQAAGARPIVRCATRPCWLGAHAGSCAFAGWTESEWQRARQHARSS